MELCIILFMYVFEKAGFVAKIENNLNNYVLVEKYGQ